MTTRDHARRTLRSPLGGERSYDADRAADSVRPSLPERLAAARESKGVDIYRAERDTKIRARYIAALEAGDYVELPGAVYTKGFLRNYAVYLGLNPDDVLAQWRRERGETVGSEPVVVVRRPLLAPRSGLILSRNVLFAVALVLIVGLVGGYLFIQISRYNQPMVVNVTSPKEGITTVAAATTKYTLRGSATANLSILVSIDGGDPQAVQVDSSGKWSMEVPLHPLNNRFDIYLVDVATQKTTKNDPVVRVINVPVPEASVAPKPLLALVEPTEGLTVESRSVIVSGTARAATKVTITPKYLGPVQPTPAPTPTLKPGTTPAPTPKPSATPKPTATPASKPSGSPSPSASASPGPSAVTVVPGSDGTFSTTLELTPGRWQIAVKAVNEAGTEDSTVRTINVAPKGVTVVVTIKNGPAWIKVWRDGTVDNTLSKTYKAGQTFTATANTYVLIRSGAPNNTVVSVNGTSYGALAAKAQPGTWRLDGSGPPKPSTEQ